MVKNAVVATAGSYTHRWDIKVLVRIWCGCPWPSISCFMPGVESPSFVLTLVGTENMGSSPGRLCSLVLCYGPMFPKVSEH